MVLPTGQHAKLNTIFHFDPQTCTRRGSLHIGYTMKPRGLRNLEPRGNYINTHVRSARVSIGFQGYLNPIGPEGFHRIRLFILYRE